ncbi:MAG: hypothetical protein RRC34_16580 [Lentisphaeria bacterium]|nr:hypothetical protein [Lentisphaeria bacterium]
MKKYLSPSEYANDLLRAHDSDYAEIKKILINDRGALGVVSALLLAINLSALFGSSVPEYSAKLLVNARLTLHLISGMFALSCIWLGSQQYLKINMLPARLAYKYKMSMSWYEEPVASLTASLAALPPAIVCGVYLTYGTGAGRLALGLIGVLYCATVVLVSISALKYHSALQKSEEVG